MMDMAEAPSSGPAVGALRTKCPFFPTNGAVLPHSGAALPAASQPVGISVARQVATPAQAGTGYRISLSRSHQKRGPPSLLS